MSNWRCKQCDKLIKPNSAAIQVGDKITFTSSKSMGKSIRMQSHEATVVKASETKLLVKGKGRMGTKLISKESAVPADSPTALSYAFMGACECGGES